MQPAGNSELQRLRGLALAVLGVLHRMAEHMMLEWDIAPVRALDARRLHVTAPDAVELVMHLLRAPFPQVPAMLGEVGA
ncbi:hypothetical protein [Burkholderia sp. JP2-270]|uniref:hypothetical protein n=1 Tax=Burkholderia sp. JP2-270 TaxID=2217913 RepID=UPI0013A6D3D3|nr:hypothetical protein [Burkholderia sp. JP2-270]